MAGMGIRGLYEITSAGKEDNSSRNEHKISEIGGDVIEYSVTDSGG